jgi:flagellin
MLLTKFNNFSDPDIQTNFSPTEDIVFQIGATNSDEIHAPSNINATTEGLGIGGLYEIFIDEQTAGWYMGKIDHAIIKLNEFRSDFGAVQNQLESSVRNLMTQQTNLKAAESVIRDSDYAQESANFSQQNIMSQAGSFALSQANSTKQNALRLLQ